MDQHKDIEGAIDNVLLTRPTATPAQARNLMPVLLHATPDHAAVEHIQGCEQRGGAVPLVVMGHGAATPLLERQPRLGAVEGLYLALLIDRQHDRMRRRIDVEADNIANLGCKLRIVGQLELPHPMWLQAMAAPNALH